MGVWDRLSDEANRRLGQTGGLPEWTELGRQVVLIVVVFLVVIYLAVGALTSDGSPPATTIPPAASGPPASVAVTTTTVAASRAPVVDAAGEPASVDPAAVAAIEASVAAEFGPRAELVRVTVTSVGPAGSPVDVTVDVDDPGQGIVAYDVTVAETAAGWEEVTDGGTTEP